MKKSKFKKILIAIIIITILGVSAFIGALPYAVARITSSIYIAINYPKSGFKFESAKYAYGFGDYFVRYVDKDGKDIGLMLTPKELPFVVAWDSIKLNGFDD
jgi:cell division protein FtsW (lipid II flippase)